MGTGACGSVKCEMRSWARKPAWKNGLVTLCVWSSRVCSAAPNYLPFHDRKAGDGYPLCGSNSALTVLSTF